MRRRQPARRPIEGLSDPVGYRRRRSRRTPVPRIREGAYVFSRRKRSRLPYAIAALLAIVLVALAVWLLSRPSSAEVSVTPDDASISFAGRTATGRLEIDELEPGEYELRVERTGFAPVARTVTVRRLSRARENLALDPLPQTIGVNCGSPAGAAITLEAGGRTFTGEGAVTRTVPAGIARVVVEMAGYNTFTRQLFVDATTTVLVHLDPEGQLVHSLGMIECAGAPKGVALTPDGAEAWTTILNGPPSIEIVDPRTGRVKAELDLGEHGAVEVVFNEAGTRAYASQMETARVFEIDVATHKVLREFPTGSPKNWSKVVELSPDEKTLYVSNWSGDSVSVIDLATGGLAEVIGVADTPRGLYAADDGKTLWVASFDGGMLQKLDLETGEKSRVFTSAGGALRHFAADERTSRLFTSDMARDCVWVTDMRTGATSKFVTTDHKPNTIDLSPDGKVLFVSCRGANNPVSYNIPGPEWGSILLFDAASGRPLDAVVGGNQCTALDVSDDGTLLVFSDFLDDRLRVYEVPPYATLAAGGGGRWERHLVDIRK